MYDLSRDPRTKVAIIAINYSSSLVALQKSDTSKTRQMPMKNVVSCGKAQPVTGSTRLTEKVLSQRFILYAYPEGTIRKSLPLLGRLAALGEFTLAVQMAKMQNRFLQVYKL